MALLKKGLVQLYTGKGKGKTSAAFGLAWRMLGRGGRVYICQFLKPDNQISGETILAERFEGLLTLERLEHGWDMRTIDTDHQQAQQARQAISAKLAQIRQLAKSGNYDVMILDEIVFCLDKKLTRREDVWAVIDERAGHVEIVLTGRDADDELIARADLVTCMEEVKHPFQKGISARLGIEY